MYTLIIEDRSGNIADEISFDQGSYTIGRVEGNDIILPSNAVSRTHARIFVSQGRCYINDLGSANGVIVDGEQITSQHELRNASQIRIGDYTLYLEHANRAADGNDVLRTHIVANDQGTFKLVRVGDMFAGEEFSLTEQNNTVGRTDDNFILLSDPSISRNHAQIVNEGMTYTLVDLGSSNGTRVNGKPARGPVTLRSGDEVEFGNVRFVFAPGNQRVDLAAYAKRRSGGSSGVTIAILVVVILLALGIVVFVTVKLLDSDSGDDGPAEASEESEEPEVDVDAKFEAANKMANEQKWNEARTLLAEVIKNDPKYPGAQELQKRVIDESTNQGRLDEGDTLFQQMKYEEARSYFEKIPPRSVYHQRAQKKLATIEERMAKDAFLEAKKACDQDPNEECVEAVCSAIELNPSDSTPRKYLQVLKGKKELRKKKELRARIDECIKLPASE